MSSEDVNPDLGQQSYEINEVIICCALENAQTPPPPPPPKKKNGLKMPTKLDQQHSKIDQHWYFFLLKRVVKVGTFDKVE